MHFATLFLVLFSIAAKADLILVYQDDSAAVVYREANQVVYKMCDGTSSSSVDRSCPSAKTPYRGDYNPFVDNIYLFYMVDPTFRGPQGPIKVTQRIEILNQQLADDSMTAEERGRAEALLSGLKDTQGKLIKARREVLDALTKEKTSIFDSRITKRFHKVISAFYPLYSPGLGHAYKLGGDNVPGRDVNKTCGSPWSQGQPDSKVLESPLGGSYNRYSLVWGSDGRTVEMSPIGYDENVNAASQQRLAGITRNGYPNNQSQTATVFCYWDFSKD